MSEKAYKIINEKGLTVYESEDIFGDGTPSSDLLSIIKRQPPGSKLIRTADGKTLAYTTAMKDFDLAEQPRKKRKRSPA